MAADDGVLSPLLKWPGGKRVILQRLLSLMPTSFNTYYEPFLGGGALFFALRPNYAVVADNNTDLVNCYIQVRNRPEEVIMSLSAYRNTCEDYYAIRARVPLHDVERAARLIYLTTLSFNGIHRVNLRGEFNVPYGYKYHVKPCDPPKIRAVSRVLSSAALICGDFESAVRDADTGDLVYFDPPYTVAHGNNGFIKYNAEIFSWADQLRLAQVAIDLSQRGCYVFVSNADHESIRDLYRDFATIDVVRNSVVAASKAYRRKVTECIFWNARSRAC